MPVTNDSLRAAVRVAYAQRKGITGDTKTFRRTYRDDPVAFIRDCFNWKEGEGPAPYQEEIAAELPVKQRVSVRGPHGLGKTALEAQLVLWFATTRDGEDWKVPTTASNWRQLTNYLWPEIHKWTRMLKWQALERVPFKQSNELLQLSLKLNTGEAFAVSSDNAGYIEGAHADSIFYCFDESKMISATIFDAAEGAFSGQGIGEAFALCISTPGEPVGRFFDIQSRKPGYEDWWVRHVTKEEAIAAGRMGAKWAEQRKRQWGEASAIYQNRVEGNFAAADEDSVIPLSWVEAAVERWHNLNRTNGFGPLTRIGGDVARGGADSTVLAHRHGNAIKELRRYRHGDTMLTAGYISASLQLNPSAGVIIDTIGVGAGVFDRLKEMGLRPDGFNAGEKTLKHDRSGEMLFVNKRSAAWWNMRDILDPHSGDNIALPPDDMLLGDLVAPKWSMNSIGKVLVETKEDVRARIGRSTDYADAVMMAFWEDRTSFKGMSLIGLPKASLWLGAR